MNLTRISKITSVVITCLALTSSLFGQEKEDYAQEFPSSQLRIKMIAIPSGTFNMGSPATEEGRDEDEGPQRKMAIEGF